MAAYIQHKAYQVLLGRITSAEEIVVDPRLLRGRRLWLPSRASRRCGISIDGPTADEDEPNYDRATVNA
jgi:hypothetical protein